MSRISKKVQKMNFLQLHQENGYKYYAYMGHAATKPDKVIIGITKNFRDQNLVM